MRNLLTVILILIATATSCTGGYQYIGYHDIPESGWPYGQQFDYTLSTKDSTMPGNLTLFITHDNSYEYSNLWLEISYKNSDNNQVVDTFNIEMCDSYGNWFGKGIPGHYQLAKQLTSRPVSIPDSNVISIRHIMRVDTLRSISQIGIGID